MERHTISEDASGLEFICPRCNGRCADFNDGYSSCCGVRLYADSDYRQDAPESVEVPQEQ